jgi:copper homeostasis protein
MQIKVYEAAVDSAAKAKEMIMRGANRIELNSHLDLGGLTPDMREVADTLKLVADTLKLAGSTNAPELASNTSMSELAGNTSAPELAGNTNTPVVIMVRPRAGDFAYTYDELGQMETTMQQIAEIGGKVVTFGVVRAKTLDTEAMGKLLAHAKHLNLEVIMHMAFDEIDPRLQTSAMEWLVEHGVYRILTHGGLLKQPIESTIPHLQTLVQNAPNALTILPGGGITHENAQFVADALNVSEVHGSKIV